MGPNGRFCRSTLDYRFARIRQMCQGARETGIYFTLDGFD